MDQSEVQPKQAISSKRGSLSTGTKHGKMCTRYQAQDNVHPVLNAVKCAPDTKRGKTGRKPSRDFSAKSRNSTSSLVFLSNTKSWLEEN